MKEKGTPELKFQVLLQASAFGMINDQISKTVSSWLIQLSVYCCIRLFIDLVPSFEANFILSYPEHAREMCINSPWKNA